MKMKFIVVAMPILLLSCNCDHRDSSKELMGVQSMLWAQYSAELEALFIQGYNIASQIVESYNSAGNGLPPAVTLDLDETVLDNSPFSVQMAREGLKYSGERWAKWCEKREALPLPGALRFTRLADSLGIEVFYVSNRSIDLMKATLENLAKFNFPNADSLHVLLKTNTSSKDERRQEISRKYEIILLIGDNLGDFDGIFDDREQAYGKENVRKYEEYFGTKYIILPNPMYGSWEKAVFPEGIPGQEEVLKKLRSYN